MNKSLAERHLGQLPLSIATSIAFESLLNMEPSENASEHVRKPKGDKQPISEFNTIWINLRTLLRNIDGAIDKDAEKNASPRDYYHVLLSEISTIDGIISNLPYEINVVYYAKSFNSLTTIWKQALFRDVTAPRLKVFSVIERNVLDFLVDDIKKEILNKDKFIMADCFIHIKDNSALLSHFPIDLLLRRGGKFKALIESHTGAIKYKKDWNTKLRDGKKYPRIPFDSAMIQIFGDSQNMLSPQSKQIREKLASMSEKYQWHPLTTKERILFCTKQEHEHVLLQLLKDCYK